MKNKNSLFRLGILLGLFLCALIGAGAYLIGRKTEFLIANQFDVSVALVRIAEERGIPLERLKVLTASRRHDGVFSVKSLDVGTGRIIGINIDEYLPVDLATRAGDGTAFKIDWLLAGKMHASIGYPLEVEIGVRYLAPEEGNDKQEMEAQIKNGRSFVDIQLESQEHKKAAMTAAVRPVLQAVAKMDVNAWSEVFDSNTRIINIDAPTVHAWLTPSQILEVSARPDVSSIERVKRYVLD